MATVDQITRLLLIVRKVKHRRDGQNITTKMLHDHVNDELELRGANEVGIRTIQRDIEILNLPPFSIALKRNAQNGYEIEESNYEGIDIDQLLEPFDLLNAFNADSGLTEIIFTEKYSYKGTEYLFKLIKAIRSHSVITFGYTKYLEEMRIRSLEPYAIKQQKGQWYLIGKDRSTQTLKTFGLDRVRELKVLAQKFKKDPAVDIAQKFEFSYGIYSSEEYPVEDVVLSFDAADGNYLKSTALHPSQEIIEDNAERFVIKLRLRITEDFVMAILARSWSLTVIEPASLRERLHEIYKKALERNDG